MSVDGFSAGGDEAGADFARELSLLDIIAIGIGAMIGGSIFVLTGLAAGEAGPALILAFALNGFITIFTGMTYAELGSEIPEPGGGYLWVRTALGRSQAFLSGWMSWFAHAVAGSLYILSFGSFVTLIVIVFVGEVPFGLAEAQPFRSCSRSSPSRSSPTSTTAEPRKPAAPRTSSRSSSSPSSSVSSAQGLLRSDANRQPCRISRRFSRTASAACSSQWG